MANATFDFSRANACFLRGDYKTAFSMYLNAAVQAHDAEAAFNVAYMYYHGLFVPQSYSLARRYYMAAQMLDGGAAQFNLALMYLRGQGGAADDSCRFLRSTSKDEKRLFPAGAGRNSVLRLLFTGSRQHGGGFESAY